MSKTNEAVNKPRCIVIGGFLGAGKTSAIAALGGFLQNKALRAGVITNDEGNGLVDTASLQARGLLVEEIAGGSLGTQLDAFSAASRRLIAEKKCDVIIAEPAGGSADLAAGVMRRLRAEKNFQIAPLSVMVDAVRAARVLRIEAGGSFSEKVSYIYRKQIEEAELLIINKTDLLTPAKLAKLRKALGDLAPGATIFSLSTRAGAGLEEWFTCLLTKEHLPQEANVLDAEIYQDGEALLGWLNCTVRVSSVKYFDGSKLLNQLATVIQSLLQQEGIEVAHLKAILRADRYPNDIVDLAEISLVRNDLAPELSGELREPLQRGQLILNLRAEAKPELLHDTVNRALLEIMERAPDLFARMEHCEHFRPNRKPSALVPAPQ